jgi:membrane protease YdiL (CAAX protease family)
MSVRKYSAATLITFIVAYLGAVILQLLGIVKTTNQAITATTICYILGAALLLFFATRLREPLVVEMKQEKSTWKQIVGLGLLGIFVVLILQSVLFQIEQLITGQSASSENTAEIMKMIQSEPLFLVTTSIAGPIMEEFVFRRVLCGALSNKINFWVAAVFSSICFAAAHADGHLLVYGGIGLFFCWQYQRTGKIWTSMISHCGMNTIVIIAQLFLLK